MIDIFLQKLHLLNEKCQNFQSWKLISMFSNEFCCAIENIYTKKTLVDYLYQIRPKLAYVRQGLVSNRGARIQFNFLGCSQLLALHLWRSARIGYSHRGGSAHFYPLIGRGWKYFQSIFSGLFYIPCKWTSQVMIFKFRFFMSHVQRSWCQQFIFACHDFYIMLIKLR